jgi:methionyl-tRNA synthetase
MSDGPLLVTCGLPYTNGPCHLGHLRTYVPADFYVRFLRRRGEEVVFVCGSDNHGTPVVVMAEDQGVSPRELSTRYHEHFAHIFQRMSIRFDHFGMTDGETNHRRTRSIVNALKERGYIYSKVVEQSYCPRCGRFLPDRYVEGICPYCDTPARGDECDQGCGRHLEPGELKKPRCLVCGADAELREQEHFFFRLSEFGGFLETYLRDLQGTANARNYALGWVKEGLRDWCITRTLDWGVKFPGHDDLVVYVWVDAPIGYISFTEEWAKERGLDWKRYWCGMNRVTHFIGSDIIYHHCIFWPALLSAAGYAPPLAVVASGMVKVDDQKFSKSRGYVVWTGEDYLDRGLPADYLRYYLVSYTNHTKELNFSWQVFSERVNNELVSTLGNFIYRSLFFAHKFFGKVPEGPVGAATAEAIQRCVDEMDRSVREFEFKGATDALMALAAYGNTYIQNQAPWKLVKTDAGAAGKVVKDCLQIAHALALLMEPVLPDAAGRVWRMLGNRDPVEKHLISDATEQLPSVPLPEPAPLFEKLEESRIRELEGILGKRVEQAKRAAAEKGLVSMEEFCRMDLRIGKVLSAEQVKGARKLLKLTVDIGDEKPRQVVAGMAEFYRPEEMIGLSVIMVTNMKPAKIFGIESHGMVLAAGDRAVLLSPLKEVPPGTKIK